MVIYYHKHGEKMISLRSKVAIKLLDYYFLNPEAQAYINELARILELDPKNTETKLKEFEKARASFNHALKINSSDDEAKKWLKKMNEEKLGLPTPKKPRKKGVDIQPSQTPPQSILHTSHCSTLDSSSLLSISVASFFLSVSLQPIGSPGLRPHS